MPPIENTITALEIERLIVKKFPHVHPKSSWGETSMFYNPDKMLPNGVYFCTTKHNDGDNDQASMLYREGIYRVAIGLGRRQYTDLFGPRPLRPAKGGVVNTGHDFTMSNILMPHPIYAWMSWGQILSPSKERFHEILPLIEEAYLDATVKFDKKVKRLA
jgi:Family of unknown function (DUF6194)